MPPAEQGGAVFDALADPTRRRMLRLLGERERGATATELAAELPVTRQAVAKHLGGLEAAHLVQSAREGREVRYRITPAPLSGAMEWMVSVGGRWDDRLAALQRQLRKRP